MTLHEDTQLFQQALRFTAQKMGLPEIYIEKDYWVTFVLHTIYKGEMANETVFKGGTSLSKCFRLIERFSEDIDLIVIRQKGETDSTLTKKIKKLGSIVSEALPEIEVEGLTQKRGMNRKTVHSYNKAFTGGVYGQVRDTVVLDATWLGYFEPYMKHKVRSFVGEVLSANGQEAISKQYGLASFEVQVLLPTRTICEKILSLVKFSHKENPIEHLSQKIRHAYDLHQLLQQPEYSDFFDSPDFEKMLLKVANDDVISYKNNNEWLAIHPSEAFIFKQLEITWPPLSEVYNNDFKRLVHGSLPNSNDVRDTLIRIRERMNPIDWNVEV